LPEQGPGRGAELAPPQFNVLYGRKSPLPRTDHRPSLLLRLLLKVVSLERVVEAVGGGEAAAAVAAAVVAAVAAAVAAAL
jgi:hypothetical protein